MARELLSFVRHDRLGGTRRARVHAHGKPYLDFFAGTATVSLGHSNPIVADAIADQARTLILTSNLMYTIPQLQLAELLVDHSCLDRVYFNNSGAEANEAAIKLARKWGHEHRNGAYEIICALDSFHGRTLAAITASGTDRYKEPFAPLPARRASLVRRAEAAAHPGRDTDRPRALRGALRLRAVRHRAGHHDAGEGD